MNFRIFTPKLYDFYANFWQHLSHEFGFVSEIPSNCQFEVQTILDDWYALAKTKQKYWLWDRIFLSYPLNLFTSTAFNNYPITKFDIVLERWLNLQSNKTKFLNKILQNSGCVCLWMSKFAVFERWKILMTYLLPWVFNRLT
mgnify:FL=1